MSKVIVKNATIKENQQRRERRTHEENDQSFQNFAGWKERLRKRDCHQTTRQQQPPVIHIRQQICRVRTCASVSVCWLACECVRSSASGCTSAIGRSTTESPCISQCVIPFQKMCSVVFARPEIVVQQLNCGYYLLWLLLSLSVGLRIQDPNYFTFRWDSPGKFITFDIWLYFEWK